MDRVEDLVGDVGVEPGLGGPDLLEPVEHQIERGGHADKLRVGLGQVDPGGEVSGGDRGRGARDARQWQHHPGEDPPHRKRERRDRERDGPHVKPKHLPHRLRQRRKRRADEQHRSVAPPADGQSGCAVGRGLDRLKRLAPWLAPGDSLREPQRRQECAVLAPNACKPGEGPAADRRRDQQSHRNGGLQVACGAEVGERELRQGEIGAEERLRGELLPGLERVEPGPQLRVDVANEDLPGHLVIHRPDRDGDRDQKQGYRDRRPPAKRAEHAASHGHPAIR